MKPRKSRALGVREADIQSDIKGWLELDGWHVFVLEAGLLEKSRKYVYEEGGPDLLAIRYQGPCDKTCVRPACLATAHVLWIEAKSRTAKHRAAQNVWQFAERERGALVWVQRKDFPPTVEGFMEHYRASGLLLREGL